MSKICGKKCHFEEINQDDDRFIMCLLTTKAYGGVGLSHRAVARCDKSNCPIWLTYEMTLQLFVRKDQE